MFSGTLGSLMGVTDADGDMWKEWLLKPCDGEAMTKSSGENERNDEFDGEIPNENGEFEAERVRRRRHEHR